MKWTRSGAVVRVTESRWDVQAKFFAKLLMKSLKKTWNQKDRELLGGSSPEREATSANIDNMQWDS